MRIFTLDNTFGYNPGHAGLTYSLHDRLALVRRFDALGIDYVEAGRPAGAGNIQKFFDYARTECGLSHTRLVATARLDEVRDFMEQDDELRAVIDAGAPAVALSACCWQAGMAGYTGYCRKIEEAVRFLKAHALEVIFRDEDFFQCYCGDPIFAMRTLEAAKSAGADVLCLRDSTGAGLPQLVREAAMEVRKRFEGILGICAHDDADLALANTLEAVEQGFTHVQGSMDAYGPRRGLANLCSIISSLEHKLGHTTIDVHKLEEMAEVARQVGEASSAAFGRRVRVGVAQMTTPGETILDGIEPKLLAALSSTGKRALLDRIHLMELEGYEFRIANGSLELLVREEVDPQSRPFIAERYDLTSHSGLTGGVSTATATVRSGESVRSETEDGDGAVNALERSLRQCLFAIYPDIATVHITDYHVTMLDPARGTASRVRVTLTWSESGERWVTAGVAGDLIEATWLALTDGFLLPLMRLGKTAAAAADSSWAV